MGYNRQQKMKKIVMALIAMVGFVFVANAQQDVKGFQGGSVLVSVSEDSQTSATLMFYNNSTKDIRVSVEIYNDQRSGVGEGTYIIRGAREQGYHSESEATISKIKACGICTSGCEVCSIKITEVKVIN